MEVKPPDSILNKIKRIEEREQKRKLREEECKKAELKKEQDLKELKKSKQEELLRYAEFVINWLKFFFSEPGQKILATLECVNLFYGRYWNGYPTDSTTTYAGIAVYKDEKLTYFERYKGFTPHQTELGKICKLGPKLLIEKLHPDFLKELFECFESGKVWEVIERELDRRI